MEDGLGGFFRADRERPAIEFTGEMRLAKAVLRQAYLDLRGAIRRRHSDRFWGYRQYDEIHAWFFNPDEPGDYSFEVVCGLLGRDVDAAREYFRKEAARIEANAGHRGKLIRKLTYGHYHQIRAAMERGERPRDIAARFGIDRSVIRKMRRGRLWGAGTPASRELPDAIAALNEALTRPRMEPEHGLIGRAVRGVRAFCRDGSLQQLEDAFADLAREIQSRREAQKAA